MSERIVWPPDQLETSQAPHRTRPVLHLHSGDAIDDPARPLHPVLEAALNRPGTVSTDAAREMIHTMQRRRRQREELAAHRARWIGYPLCAAAVLIGFAGMVTPNQVAAVVLGALSVACVAVAGGMWLRGRL